MNLNDRVVKPAITPKCRTINHMMILIHVFNDIRFIVNYLTRIIGGGAFETNMLAPLRLEKVAASNCGYTAKLSGQRGPYFREELLWQGEPL